MHWNGGVPVGWVDIFEMFETFAPFTIGLIGSLHCLGMCGPLILAYSFRTESSRSQSSRGGIRARLFESFFQHFAFHAGRVLSYGVLGALVGALFGSLEVQRFSMQYRGGFLILCGIVLLALGLVILRIFALPSIAVRLLSPSPALGGKLNRLLSSGSMASRMCLGLGAGLIPCGLTWAMLVAAAATLSPAKGMLTMISFGSGTIPLLLVSGMSASFLGAKTRLMGERAAAISIMVMGMLLLMRGVEIVRGWGDHCGGIGLLWQNGLLK